MLHPKRYPCFLTNQSFYLLTAQSQATNKRRGFSEVVAFNLNTSTKESGYENRSSTSQVRYDEDNPYFICQGVSSSGGGVIKTSYENKGSNLLLILYDEKNKEYFKKLDQILKSSHFTIQSILINDIEVIDRLSRFTDFKKVSSLTVIVLAEICAVEIVTGYCEQLSLKFSTFEIQLNAGTHQIMENIAHINNHSDFLWAHCYGK
ncbi:hypothetical protein B566_EDAN016147, partial [Ephemera danica]